MKLFKGLFSAFVLTIILWGVIFFAFQGAETVYNFILGVF